MAMKIYSADEVGATFAGIPLEAENDSEFIAITKPDDAFTYKGGINGFGTRSRNKTRYYEVTVTLPQTSPTNALLSSVHNLDRSVNGSGVAPIGVIDTNGLTVFGGTQAWIKKMPDWAAANESGTVQWVFAVHDGEFLIGGN